MSNSNKLEKFLHTLAMLGLSAGVGCASQINSRQNQNPPEISLNVRQIQSKNHPSYQADFVIKDSDSDLERYELFIDGKKVAEDSVEDLRYSQIVNPSRSLKIRKDAFLPISPVDQHAREVLGYGELYMDNSQLSLRGPNVFGKLSVGNHKFKVIAYDKNGNRTKTDFKYTLK